MFKWIRTKRRVRSEGEGEDGQNSRSKAFSLGKGSTDKRGRTNGGLDLWNKSMDLGFGGSSLEEGALPSRGTFLVKQGKLSNCSKPVVEDLSALYPLKSYEVEYWYPASTSEAKELASIPSAKREDSAGDLALKGEGRVECQQTFIIELTRPDPFWECLVPKSLNGYDSSCGRGNRDTKIFSHCGVEGHTVDYYYDLHGRSSALPHYANHALTSDTKGTQTSMSGRDGTSDSLVLSKELYMKFLQFQDTTQQHF
ncbi:hypothetical protein Salat_0843300 [Sesamum alatum]|uniref:Uncharacterized protein n=1 Tax=Sesamum alatum TaxID=300844 RepID=A0AAE1YJ87_9LAMI|nr:hypothetical protein Salat_0843300 [Sesamum alatum]